jgi:hypothetical protein
VPDSSGYRRAELASCRNCDVVGASHSGLHLLGRRLSPFIYDPSKLDSDAPNWMANKSRPRCPAYCNVLLQRNLGLADRVWFRWLAGSLPLPLTDVAYRNLSFAVLVAVLAYNIGAYNYYRGSVVTPYHSGPVSPSQDHFTFSDGMVLPDGGVRFHIYLDGGAPEVSDPYHEGRTHGRRRSIDRGLEC